MPYKVRAASASDAAQIAVFNSSMALETEQLQLDEKVLRRGVDAVFAEPERTSALYFVAEEEKEEEEPPTSSSSPSSAAVACAMITFEWSDWRDGRVWWLQSVYCAPDHRRRGVFKMIYDFIKNEAKRQGARGLRLYADTTNDRAHSVYEALGMKTGHYQVFEDMFAS